MTLEKFYKLETEADFRSFIELMPDTRVVIITSSGKDYNWSTDSAKGLYAGSLKSMIDRGVYIKTSEDFHEWALKKVQNFKESNQAAHSNGGMVDVGELPEELKSDRDAFEEEENATNDHPPFSFDTEVNEEDMQPIDPDNFRQSKISKHTKLVYIGLVVLGLILLSNFLTYAYCPEQGILEWFMYAGIITSVFIVFNLFSIQQYSNQDES